MYGALDISASGLVAQRTRLNIISANLANQHSLLNEAGEYDPYRRRFAVFQAAEGGDNGKVGGVSVAEIREDQSDFTLKLDADSPYADENGYVAYPNVNTVVETMNAMEATRSYEANIMAVEATKSMMNVSLQIIR